MGNRPTDSSFLVPYALKKSAKYETLDKIKQVQGNYDQQQKVILTELDQELTKLKRILTLDLESKISWDKDLEAQVLALVATLSDLDLEKLTRLSLENPEIFLNYVVNTFAKIVDKLKHGQFEPKKQNYQLLTRFCQSLRVESLENQVQASEEKLLKVKFGAISDITQLDEHSNFKITSAYEMYLFRHFSDQFERKSAATQIPIRTSSFLTYATLYSEVCNELIEEIVSLYSMNKIFLYYLK